MGLLKIMPFKVAVPKPKRNRTSEGIKRTTNKIAKGKVFKETLKNRDKIVKNGKKVINYNFSTAKTTNVPGLLKNIHQISNNETIQQGEGLNFRLAIKGIKKQLMERDDGKFVKKYGKEKAEKIINQVVNETSAVFK